MDEGRWRSLKGQKRLVAAIGPQHEYDKRQKIRG